MLDEGMPRGQQILRFWQRARPGWGLSRGGGRQPLPQGARLCREAWAACGHSGQLMVRVPSETVGLCFSPWEGTWPSQRRGSEP